ncbi:MAG: glycine cleavage system protein GcvH [Bacteroidetes bacterium]|jgi:glycine cleavage system H protein|uniref:glycine cleavage system protein GcvH n=1 Tax=uncultured Dysgonomonas sp. TaxID=206096 RepID=UPI001AC1F0EB|nr:glycine cleavage system protein GcvH [uncultured Dysgonomonas sp.]MBN9484552.1 glycine cleavage system protein GcvH [Bacteroidota bacterium]MBS1748863.1 glycine cleavage system protein GcvH [Bacteroidota bacterium]MBX3255656.1 glycine cleavage system protein GcvH [Chitinophagaceae bacterium]
MNFPEQLKYHKEHTWLRIEGNTGTIGITEFAQSELGEIVYVDQPNIGNSYKQDEVFGTVEAVKTVSDLFMPVSGKVTAINSGLRQEPALVNSDPFGEGWMIQIELTDTSETAKLLDAAAYRAITQ